MTKNADKPLTGDEIDALPYEGPTKEELAAEEALAYERCLQSATCLRRFRFAWEVKLDEEERAQKCKGRCLCAEVKGRPVAVEFDFELTPGEKTIVTFP